MNYKYFLLLLVAYLSRISGLGAVDTYKSTYQNVQVDSVTLYTPDLDVAIGDYVCVPILVKDFAEITGFQFALQWDIETLAFSDIQFHELSDIAFNDSDADDGVMRLLWYDSQASPTSLMDGDTLVEICFTTMGFDQTSTQMLITALPDFPIEISGLEVIDHNIQNGQIKLTNLLDCFLVPICIESMEVNFEPGVQIFPQDIVENLDYFLACYRLNIEDIYLIDMSQPDAEILPSITYQCGDLHEPTTLGLVVYESRSAAPIDIYNIICQTSVSWNIPDIYVDCISNDISCLDPSRCLSAEIEIDSTVTTIYYDQLLGPATETCDIEYTSQYTSIALDGSVIDDGFQLTCLEYESELNITLSLIQSYANGSQLIAFDWCESNVGLSNIESTCESQDIPTGQAPVNIINEKQISLDLNGESIRNNGAFQFLMPQNKIIDVFNHLQIANNFGTLDQVSTLDMVLIYKYMVSEVTSPPMAIAGDVDLSGSVTTKDLLTIRKTILGIDQPIHIGKAFMIETRTDFTGFDFFNFQNDYQSYYFDGPSFDPNEGLNFEVFTYGDVNSSVSDLHKTNENTSTVMMNIENRYVNKGARISIPLTLLNEQQLLGLSMAIETKGLSIEHLSHDYTGDILKSNLKDQEQLNISIFSPQKSVNLNVTIEVLATTNGYLHDMISVNSESIIPEVVFEDLNTGLLQIEWVEPIQRSPTQIYYYPNPTSEVLNLEIPDLYLGGSLGVYNVIGKLLYEESILDNSIELNMEKIHAKGIVMIKVKNKEFQKAFRVAVER